MRKTIIPIVIVAVLLFVALPQVFFVIDETELAIVTRFGAFQREYKEPGLKIKTPIVDNVTKFDKRLLRIDASPKVPVFLLLIEEPIDSAQSSISLILFFFAIDEISLILHGKPAK